MRSAADDVRMTCAHVDDVCMQMTCADHVHMRTTCVDDVRVTPGVVLHKIGQLRQVFAWVPVWMLSARHLEACMSSARGNSSA